MKNKKTLIIGLVIIIVLFWIALANNYIQKRNDPTTLKKDSVKIEQQKAEEAYSAAIQLVEDQLKAPQTADFPILRKISYKHENNLWTFNGYVDSQNSFGALIRTDYTLEMVFDPIKKTYLLKKFVSQPR
jgi:hypothetical protein